MNHRFEEDIMCAHRKFIFAFPWSIGELLRLFDMIIFIHISKVVWGSVYQFVFQYQSFNPQQDNFWEVISASGVWHKLNNFSKECFKTHWWSDFSCSKIEIYILTRVHVKNNRAAEKKEIWLAKLNRQTEALTPKRGLFPSTIRSWLMLNKLIHNYFWIVPEFTVLMENNEFYRFPKLFKHFVQSRFHNPQGFRGQ